jgi:hypothetical protein
VPISTEIKLPTKAKAFQWRTKIRRKWLIKEITRGDSLFIWAQVPISITSAKEIGIILKWKNNNAWVTVKIKEWSNYVLLETFERFS